MENSENHGYPITPMDFYKFQHRVELVKNPKRKRKQEPALLPLYELPLWIVGASPFDKVNSPDEGHVVHLGKPRFTARWTVVEETLEQIPAKDFFDEDLNLAIYEVIPLDGSFKDIKKWLPEAANAVAFFKGMIAESAAVEEH